LRREGVPASRIERVGNIMIDSYEMVRPRIEADQTRAAMNLQPGKYGIVTLHRPSNVDDPATLKLLVTQLIEASQRLPLVFAVHPRTRKRLQEFGLLAALESSAAIRLTEPLGYIQFMNLVSAAKVVVTDSGGVQEESTYLGIPCLTLRENTERPITLTEGSNRLVKPADMKVAFDQALAGQWTTGRRPEFWDGKTAARCVAALRRLAQV
jgi:UDP-N-acetylglucosamine 2-epimerase (non-hydrolysing)